MIKRAFDLLCVVIALPLVAPCMALIGLAVALGHDGPVFFRQVRVGLNREPFTIIKFRTMRHRPAGAIDQAREAVVTDTRDERITRVGRFLRATSLDELPQIINVLGGTMSLVGPRPLIPEQLSAVPEGFGQRFAVRPGITGWAQVNGRRSLGWLRQLELDVWYVEHRSLWLDICILLKTVMVVLKRSGVYGTTEDNWRAYLDSKERT